MNRRKFIAGVGGLAATGAFTLGSGAFSSVSAERTVSINVANDQNAYLVLDGIDENFAEDDQLVNFDFDEEVTPSGGGTFDETGDGVGANSIYEFTELFQIQNQGTDDAVVFGIYEGDELESLELIEEGRKAPLTKLSPSSIILAPGDFIRAGLRIETGDIPPQEIQTELTIVGATKNSERFPNVFPDGTSSS